MTTCRNSAKARNWKGTEELKKARNIIEKGVMEPDVRKGLLGIVGYLEYCDDFTVEGLEELEEIMAEIAEEDQR